MGVDPVMALLADRQPVGYDVELVPDPASAVMAGMHVVVVASTSDGSIDVQDLTRKADEHKDRLAALMVTYPSTHGVFEEAIQDDLQPRPELEFTTNAIEHLRLGNHRFALLEAIIGLEIVLARFLQSYLKVRKGLSKTRIEKFLSPDLGLTARVAGVLDLVLTKEQLEQTRIENVLSAIKWRNTVVHRTGRLPDNLPEETLRDGVFAVLGLTDLLADEADSIEAEHDMELIAAEIAAKLQSLPRPKVRYLGRHGVGVWFMKAGFDDSWIPTKDIEEIVASVGQLRRSKDSRFDPLRHLQVMFQTIPGDEIMRWRAGQWAPLRKR